MSRRGTSATTLLRPPRLPDQIGEYPLGKHTGLPLIICDLCGQHRVMELVTKSDENGNKGRIFFKCPRNMIGVPAMYGTCGFFEWQREYLEKLVEMGKVVMVLEEHPAIEDEADSKAIVQAVAVHKNPMELKIEALVGAVKTLCMVIAAGVVVGAIYVMK